MKHRKFLALMTLVIVIVILALGIMTAVILVQKHYKFSVDTYKNCSITYWEDEAVVEKTIDDADGEEIYAILNGKYLFHENFSCGFSENMAIYFNDGSIAIYIASDSCGNLYSVNDKKYIAINDDDLQTIVNILQRYGMPIRWQKD